MSSILTAEQGLLEISILNSETNHSDFADVVAELSSKIPLEIITRLKELWEKTKEIAGEVIQIGKIIIIKVLEFIRENPNMAAGIAIGAVIGAFVGMVPFLGPLLQPLVTVIGVTLGAFVGGQMDRGGEANSVMEDAILTARKFTQLITDIFNAVNKYWETR